MELLYAAFQAIFQAATINKEIYEITQNKTAQWDILFEYGIG